MRRVEDITIEAHERLWSRYLQVARELVEATATIYRLAKGDIKRVEVAGVLEPKMVIGIVQCPKCGQMMEVEK